MDSEFQAPLQQRLLYFPSLGQVSVEEWSGITKIVLPEFHSSSI